ncbi:hypothetical protein NHX12_022831 [Muraenolepis orangiensis]|uniref:Coiled-coil domain-containing protein 177 n=1 Tax=Muraenolepis orangiensis TaxID=630683 RepID=A0A9Q0ENZ8_9TELE|nr:hypothetical protein NHX12_022831 [Muraenolepis orangiensis]
MGDITQPFPNSDLDNCETSGAERSPRSRSGVKKKKPVQLLIKSLNEFVNEVHETPYEAVTVMHESYEKERRKQLLQLCRGERERIIREDEIITRPPHPQDAHLSALEVVGKAFSRSSDNSGSQHGHLYDDGIAAPVPCGDQGFISSSSLGKPSRSTTTTATTTTLSNCETSSYKPGNTTNNNNNRVVSTSCNHILGDLRHSPATQTQLEKLTGDIHQKMRVTVSEKDRKIAALMLVKHGEERVRLSLSQQKEREREEARGEEAARRAQEEKSRRRRLRQNGQHWLQKTEALRKSRERRHRELAWVRERQALLQDERRQRSTEELEARRRERTEAVKREAQARKRCQERLLRNRHEAEKMEREREARVALDREQKAKREKVTRQSREKKKLSQENHRELLQHLLLKQRAEQQVQEEKALARSALEKRLGRSREKQAQDSEGRLRELRERGARQAEHTQQAKTHAELHGHQQLRRRQLLVQQSQRRMDRAAQQVATRLRVRAQQTHQQNLGRRLSHRQLREKATREEEARMATMERHVTAKERRREELRAQREQAQEEGRRAAHASSHLRERVKERTEHRTFDRMALEAQLSASMAGIKLQDISYGNTRGMGML